jgi:cell division protein ZapE
MASTLTPQTSHLLKPAPRPADFMSLYRARLSEGWQPDAGQALAVNRLNTLLNALHSQLTRPPRGLWLYGPPGRGKSQLLDLFMAQVPTPAKRRIHFHGFMEELHRRLHAMPSGKGDPLGLLAAEIAAEASVLGFDEFYLTNIADAMLLGRLMKFLFKQNVVVVATSNWAMPDLFQGGLNRDRFLPFLRLMEEHFEPIDLRQGPDWRLTGHAPSASDYILTRPGESADAQLQVLFNAYAHGAEQPKLTSWHPKKQKGRAVWLTFAEACDKPRSRGEYAQLVGSFSTIIIEAIPQLTAREADAALRLATLIDIMYEQNRRLVVSAAVPPEEICPEGDAAQVFQRTASRLVQLTRSKV